MVQFGLCLTALLFLIASYHQAHSQDCNWNVTIKGGGGLRRLQTGTETGTKVCFICSFGGVIDTGTQWRIGNPPQAIPSGDGSVIDGVLVINNLTTVFDQNLRLLICEAGDGSVSYEIAISLAIFVPPTIDGLTVVNETDTLMLLCDTSQSAPVPSPSWLDPNGTEVSTVASLVIENMNRSQAGLYTCVIMQGSNEPKSANVTVSVQYAPDVNTTVSAPHLSPRDQPLSLSCDYDSVPPPDITWLFEGSTRMESDLRVIIVSTETHSDFTLSGLMENEAGLYSCRASNLLGMDSVEIMVTVQVPPEPPSGLEVTDQTANTLSLQWTNRGDGLSPITGIEIEYQIQGSVPVMNETIPEVVEEFTLESLMPFSTYDIKVYVVNAVDRSEPNTTNGTTDSLPLPAPTITRFVAESSTELRLEWELPAFDSATMSPVVSWVVEYGRESSSSDSMKDVLGNVTSLLIPNLEKGVNYTARVAGRNERRSGVVQLGEFSSTATNQTDVDPPSAPVNLTAYGLTSFSIRLMWQPPADNGGRSIIDYRIEARVINGTNGTDEFVVIREADVLEDIIRDSFGLVTLEENTTVEVRVSANNGEEGDTATAVATTLPLSVPQPLLDAPNVENVTSSSVTITWDFPGGVVDYFVIQYKLRLIVWLDSGVENITISGTRDIVTINGLAADSSYDIRIRTKNDLGVSEWSPAASFITLEEPILPSPTPTPEPTEEPDIEGPTGPTAVGVPVVLICNLGGGVMWSRQDDEELPEGSTEDGNELTIPNPQTEDSGVYVCTAEGGATATFQLTVTSPTTEEDDNGGGGGIDILIIIIVAVVGGVSLAVFLIVVIVAVCYFCRRRTPGKKYKVDTKRANMTWIDTASPNTFVPSTNPGARRSRDQDDTPVFDMPEDYQAHSSFNTLEKQRRVRRSPSPATGTPYAQLDLARPVTGVRDTTGPVQYSRVAPMSYESSSPTSFQYVSDLPARSAGYSGSKRSQHYAQDWPDNQPPHYSNTVV